VLAALAAGVLTAAGGGAGAAVARPCGGASGAAPRAARTVLAPPPSGSMYHAAYPDFVGSEDRVSADRIRSFERLARRRVAWAYFSNNWTRGISFPAAKAAVVHELGRTPFIRLMARSDFGGGADPVYKMQRIVDGEFDADLRLWCAAAAATDYPLMCEFGTEVNGDWFPWNGRWNGGGTTDGYGDPTLADGPERFRDAYRHIVDISRLEGATNITWVFHVNSDSRPVRAWNTYAAYYPGDDYVDWIGVSVYGGLEQGDYWGSFRSILSEAYPGLCALSAEKPLAVLEWGMVHRCGHTTQARWVGNALANLRAGRWPRVKAVSYWHEDWRNGDGSLSDLRIDASPATLRTYREGIGGAPFVTQATFLTTP